MARREAHPSTPKAPATLEWVPLPMTAAPQALGGQRLSQIVYEYESPTPTGQHVAVRLERTSTGGTRREAEFTRAASGPMSGAERANKKRCRATLFPEQQASVRKKDVQRKRRAAAATEAAAATAAAEQAELAWWEDQQDYWATRLQVEFWSDRCLTWFAVDVPYNMYVSYRRPYPYYGRPY